MNYHSIFDLSGTLASCILIYLYYFSMYVGQPSARNINVSSKLVSARRNSCRPRRKTVTKESVTEKKGLNCVFRLALKEPKGVLDVVEII